MDTGRLIHDLGVNILARTPAANPKSLSGWLPYAVPCVLSEWILLDVPYCDIREV